MNTTPKISVIMSVFNEEQYVREAVESILNQTEKDFEFIIIDDCSTDSTPGIIGEIHDDRIVLIRNDVNQGLTKNLNKALNVAKGTYIARMDGDDISKPERFAVQVKYLDEHPEIMLISCNTETFGEQHLVSDITGTPEELKCKMLLRPVLAHPGFMFRKSLVDEYGLTYDPHFRSAQDYDFAARVTRSHQIFVVPEVLLQYRAHKGQVSQTPNLKQFGFADEVRRRLLGEMGIELNDEELACFHKWILEVEADDDTFKKNYELIKIIAENNQGQYSPKVLKRTLRKQFCQWMLRSNGYKKILGLFRLNPIMYLTFFEVSILMVISKNRRRGKC